MPSPHATRPNAIFNDTSSDGWGKNIAVQVIRRLGPDECDAEVGPMYEIIRADGQTRHAFRDELRTLAGNAFSLRPRYARDLRARRRSRMLARLAR